MSNSKAGFYLGFFWSGGEVLSGPSFQESFRGIREGGRALAKMQSKLHNFKHHFEKCYIIMSFDRE